MRIVFFGSSEFSMLPLKACLESSHEVILVVTTPDRKRGRGLKLLPNVVKQYCLDQNIPVEDYSTLKDSAALENVAALKPDIFVLASYGKLIPNDWLALPSTIRLNVHPSLLPKYRGAAPIQWPIIDGEEETGVTILDIAEKLDAGEIYLQKKYSLSKDIDAEKLFADMAQMSYELLTDALKTLESGSLPGEAQDESKATYARKLSKQDGLLKFSDPAQKLDGLIRGLKPWPGTYISFNNEPLIIAKAQAQPDSTAAKVGAVTEVNKDGSVCVGTGHGCLKIIEVKPAGKKAMKAADFARGKRLNIGDLFGDVS